MIKIWEWSEQILISHTWLSTNWCFDDHGQSKRPRIIKFNKKEVQYEFNKFWNFESDQTMIFFGIYDQIWQMYQGRGTCQNTFLITNVFYLLFVPHIVEKFWKDRTKYVGATVIEVHFVQYFARNLANFKGYRNILDPNLCYQYYVLFKPRINKKLWNDWNIFSFFFIRPSSNIQACLTLVK